MTCQGGLKLLQSFQRTPDRNKRIHQGRKYLGVTWCSRIDYQQIFQGLFAAHPGREDIRHELEETAETFRQFVYRERFQKESVPGLEVSS